MALKKIASAIYLVTSFFPDQEPMKWRLRGFSNDLVSTDFKDKFSIASNVISLLTVAKTAGLISETNHNILSTELIKLADETKNPLGSMLISAPSEETPPFAKTESTKVIKDNTPKLRELGAVSVKKNSRQSVIFSLLKRKKEIMIKDVSPLISGCSEKTIQRELADMVNSGILRRIGEKRWSRYTLADEAK